MLTLAWYWILLALPLPWFFKKSSQADVARLKLPTALISNNLGGSAPERSQLIKWLAILAWVALILAAARPVWVGEPVALKRQGRDLMLAVDLSWSMRLEDMLINGRPVSRHQMVQSILGEFIERRDGDRLGLILFADNAYLQAPLTFDRNTVRRYMDETVLGLVGRQTAIGDAIALGVKRFNELEQSSRIMVLLTDGENNAGRFEPAEAVELAQKAKVKLYIIGLGSNELQRRGMHGLRTLNPSSDLDAVEVELTQLATSTGGQYFRARSSEQLQQVYSEIDRLEPLERGESQWRPRAELYPWPLGLSLCLLAVTLLWRRHD